MLGCCECVLCFLAMKEIINTGRKKKKKKGTEAIFLFVFAFLC